MSEIFHKFPHTPHLLWLGEGTPREDKILTRSEAVAFLAGEVVVEEKVDGANLGLSVGPDGRLRAQSRANYLNPAHCHSQWKPLWPWLRLHQESLTAALGGNLILYGEWCHARHTVAYDRLPDWFFAFDIFEPASGYFWSTTRRNALARSVGLKTVPELFRGGLQFNQIRDLMSQSKVASRPAEGLYLRREDDCHLLHRAKVIAPAFQQQIEKHWTRRPLIPNHLVRPQQEHE